MGLCVLEDMKHRIYFNPEPFAKTNMKLAVIGNIIKKTLYSAISFVKVAVYVFMPFFALMPWPQGYEVPLGGNGYCFQHHQCQLMSASDSNEHLDKLIAIICRGGDRDHGWWSWGGEAAALPCFILSICPMVPIFAPSASLRFWSVL